MELLQVARYYTVASLAVGVWDWLVRWPSLPSLHFSDEFSIDY